MRPRWRTWMPFLAVLLAGGVFWLWADYSLRALVGPRHEFTVANPPAFLTEELALAKAREALALDVPDDDEWEVKPDGRSTAPDGRRDEYLSRNTINPNQGSVVFRKPGKPWRSVSVELIGDRVVCQSAQAK